MLNYMRSVILGSVNDVTIALLLCLCFIILYVRKKFTYWVGSGFPYIKPVFPYGNLEGTMDKIHLTFQLQNYYNEMKGKGPFGGLYLMWRPAVLALDLDFVKTVLIKDFNCFQDRGVYYNERDDPLSAHLIAVDGHKWKTIRTVFTPTFTSGKMRYMYPTMTAVGDRLADCLSNVIPDSMDVEIGEYLARFTTDVIGNCAFGIECNSLRDPNAQFRMMCRKIFKEPRHSMRTIFLMAVFPNLCRFLGMKTHTDEVLDFFMGIVRENIKYRETNNIVRSDFMDILLKLKNDKSDASVKLTVDEISAQVFVFFAAGYETSATAMGFSLYELALNPEIQRRARQEIHDVLQKHDGKCTYEAMMEMNYIDCIINESLRKHPPVGLLFRSSTKEYKVPEYDFILPKHTKLWIPIYAIHHDPEYYPEPEKFDPDRFTPEEIKKRHPLSFLPFGNGPRNCIGIKFGMMQARVGLISLLRSFEFTACSKTQKTLDFVKKELILTPKGGMWLNLRKINNNKNNNDVER